jgi:hypothetical protein
MRRFVSRASAALVSLAVFAGPGPCVAVEPGAAGNTPLASIPLEFHEDLPYLQIKVNDAEPAWFIFDSGASANVVDKGHAKTFGVAITGGRKGQGAGAGTVDFLFGKGVRYTVGGLSLTVDQSYVIDLSGVSTPKDRKLAGLLGYDFLQRYVVALDYEKSLLHVYEPKTYAYRGPGQALPLAFTKKLPYVKGTILVPGLSPSADREWLVDTGSGDTVNDELLARSTGEKKEVTGGRGLGKEFQVWQAQAERVELGRYHLQKVTGVSGGMKIGSGLLRKFTVIFDYPGKRMILEPNGRYRD